jgi:hypothetical protein
VVGAYERWPDQTWLDPVQYRSHVRKTTQAGSEDWSCEADHQ